jgi:hypothetical protein
MTAVVLAPVIPSALFLSFLPVLILCSLLAVVALGLHWSVGRRTASGLMLAGLLAVTVVAPLMATTTTPSPTVPIQVDCLGLPDWLCYLII